jgi:hypothetical protein
MRMRPPPSSFGETSTLPSCRPRPAESASAPVRRAHRGSIGTKRALTSLFPQRPRLLIAQLGYGTAGRLLSRGINHTDRCVEACLSFVSASAETPRFAVEGSVRGLAPWSLFLPLSWAAPAAAQPLAPTGSAAPSLPGRLSVQRGPGAEQCPEQGALERRVEGIVSHAWSNAGEGVATALAIDVRFERASDGAFVARVAATGPKPGQRVLRDANPTCDALGEAVSVAIALLLDSALNDERASPTLTRTGTRKRAPRISRPTTW